MALDAAGFEALLTQLRGLSIRDTGVSPREPVCSGGTSERLELHAGASERFRAERNHCPPGPIGRLAGEVPRLVEILQGVFDRPDCTQASDCAPDDSCVPTTCVPRAQAGGEEVCEESGPPSASAFAKKERARKSRSTHRTDETHAGQTEHAHLETGHTRRRSATRELVPYADGWVDRDGE